jgi:exodeoxyribonuclease-3
VKIATWNVNSIRARLDRLLGFLDRQGPDVVCLQETKVTEESFPADPIREAGYRSVASGQKTYNGVALLSKREATDPVRAFEDGGDDSEARLVAATVEGVRCVCVYVPNGREVGSDSYRYKLEWMARLKSFLARDSDPERPLALLGDLNVAPDDIDVHDPEAWRERILCSTAEREALRDVSAWGLTDAFRHLHPDAVAYSWWDYRQLGFPKNRGLRIDHILMTRPLLERCTDVVIDRDERKGKGPSDHAPVLATID